MAHTDPIADMLTRMKNAIMAEKKDVAIPLSNIKLEIAKILKHRRIHRQFPVDKTQVPAQLFVELKYSGKKQNVIEGLKRISKPGRRVYAEADASPRCSTAWAWRSFPLRRGSSPAMSAKSATSAAKFCCTSGRRNHVAFSIQTRCI